MKSDTEMEMVFKSQLVSLQNQKKRGKKKEEAKKGIAKYLCEDTDSEDSNDSLNDDDNDDLTSGGYLGAKSIMQQDEHPSKLIDLELLNLLKFCGDLFTTYKHNNEDYQEEIMLKSIELGKKQKQKVLVLDMDETMVSARFKSRMPPGFVTTFVVDFQDQPIHVRVRPYLQDCLERLSQLYEIVVFTAGVQEYADKILDQIDPERKIIKKRMYRQDCIQVQDFFVKDLDVFIDREKENIVIVDNSIMSFAFDLDNGVPIQSFMGNEEEDKELLFLISFLEEAFYTQDVRPSIREAFKLSYLMGTIENDTDAANAAKK